MRGDRIEQDIEQDNDEYSPYALILPGGAAYAPLP